MHASSRRRGGEGSGVTAAVAIQLSFVTAVDQLEPEMAAENRKSFFDFCIFTVVDSARIARFTIPDS